MSLDFGLGLANESDAVMTEGIANALLTADARLYHTGSEDGFARLIQSTHLLDYEHPDLAALVSARGWHQLTPFNRIGAAYAFVRDEVVFGYNRSDVIPASEVLRDGYGQCNTKGTLFMALLRALGVPCRIHGFTITKALQRGVVPELAYLLAPDDILHSWVEVWHDGRWTNLEGFILDRAYLSSLKEAFGLQGSLCAYGAGTEDICSPSVDWQGADTYIQKTGINADLGVFDTPDLFYTQHQQRFSPFKHWLYSHVIRHWMNQRTKAIRRGRIPSIPGDQNP